MLIMYPLNYKWIPIIVEFVPDPLLGLAEGQLEQVRIKESIGSDQAFVADEKGITIDDVLT